MREHFIWVICLPLRHFEAVASSLVEPPLDGRLSRDELRVYRNVPLEELEKPQAGGMGSG
jgi:hypothetical protein